MTSRRRRPHKGLALDFRGTLEYATFNVGQLACKVEVKVHNLVPVDFFIHDFASRVDAPVIDVQLSSATPLVKIRT